MTTINSFLRHNSKDVFLAASRGSETPIQDNEFFQKIPQPLQSFTFIQTLIQLEANDITLQQSATDLIDEFEISTREHVLSLANTILQSNQDAAITEETIEELLSFIRNVIDVILHLLYRHLEAIHKDNGDNKDDVDNDDLGSLYTKLITSINLRKIPFLILEDLIDALPTKTIQCFWNYGPSLWLNDILCKEIPVEYNMNNSAKSTKFKKDDITLFHQQSQYCVLRFCNKLLKNLSVSGSNAQAQFAGQITMTLASVFPLSERSAMNVLGAFNVDNVVEYENLDEWLKSNSSNTNDNSGNSSSSSKASVSEGSLNYDFYKTFWALQDIFSDPTTLLKGSNEGGASSNTTGWNESSMDAFIKSVEVVLGAFECNKFPNRLVKDMKYRWSDARKRTISDKYTPDNNIAMDIDEEQKSVDHKASSWKNLSSKRHNKYMTNSQLLHLQLQDPEIRMHILTQLFIISAYLSYSISSNEDMNKMTVARVCGNLTKLEERAGELLKLTPPNGQIQYKTLRWILQERETIWREWKKSKCEPQIAKKHDKEFNCDGSKKQAQTDKTLDDDQSILESLSNHYTFKVDKSTLSSISMSITNKYTPNYVNYLEEYVNALDPEEGIEEEYHPKNDKLFTWRAMRLLNNKHIGKLGVDKFGHQMIDLKTGDFEGLVRKIWKDEQQIIIPGEVPIAEEIVEVIPKEEEDHKNEDDDAVPDPMEQTEAIDVKEETECEASEQTITYDIIESEVVHDDAAVASIKSESKDNDEETNAIEINPSEKETNEIEINPPEKEVNEEKPLAENGDDEEMVEIPNKTKSNDVSSESVGQKRKREDDENVTNKDDQEIQSSSNDQSKKQNTDELKIDNKSNITSGSTSRGARNTRVQQRGNTNVPSGQSRDRGGVRDFRPPNTGRGGRPNNMRGNGPQHQQTRGRFGADGPNTMHPRFQQGGRDGPGRHYNQGGAGRGRQGRRGGGRR